MHGQITYLGHGHIHPQLCIHSESHYQPKIMLPTEHAPLDIPQCGIIGVDSTTLFPIHRSIRKTMFHRFLQSREVLLFEILSGIFFRTLSWAARNGRKLSVWWFLLDVFRGPRWPIGYASQPNLDQRVRGCNTCSFDVV